MPSVQELTRRSTNFTKAAVNASETREELPECTDENIPKNLTTGNQRKLWKV